MIDTLFLQLYSLQQINYVLLFFPKFLSLSIIEEEGGHSIDKIFDILLWIHITYTYFT